MSHNAGCNQVAVNASIRIPGQCPGPQAHYDATAPEIWKQTRGAVAHFVAGLPSTWRSPRRTAAETRNAGSPCAHKVAADGP